MSKIFRPLIQQNRLIAYLDDVLMQTPTINDMFFFLKEVKFLGNMIKKNEVRPLQKKIDAFLNLQSPTSKKKVQEFIGFLTFISKYIFNLNEMLRPFYLLLLDTVDFK